MRESGTAREGYCARERGSQVEADLASRLKNGGGKGDRLGEMRRDTEKVVFNWW